jgi:hypothetical protein
MESLDSIILNWLRSNIFIVSFFFISFILFIIILIDLIENIYFLKCISFSMFFSIILFNSFHVFFYNKNRINRFFLIFKIFKMNLNLEEELELTDFLENKDIFFIYKLNLVLHYIYVFPVFFTRNQNKYIKSEINRYVVKFYFYAFVLFLFFFILSFFKIIPLK